MTSKIEWTDATWNIATGCTKVSPGCDNCYMYSLYPRLHLMGVNGYPDSPDVVNVWEDRLGKPLDWKRPRMVFVCSMSDLFHHDVPYDFIDRAFDVMCEADWHIFQLLTKRPGLAVDWWKKYSAKTGREWPDHVWMGTSVESQKYAPRIDVINRIPARVRWVSAEPLLGHLDLSEWLDRDMVSWLVVGGESGAGNRPMDMENVRELRDQCNYHGVPFFLKQLGGSRDKRGGEHAVVDDTRWIEMPRMNGTVSNQHPE